MSRTTWAIGFLLMLVLVPFCVWAGSKNSGQTAELHFLVVRQENGKPLRNASVVVHQLDKDGRQRMSLQLKTDSEGKATLDGISFGKVRVQVIVQGFQTFGEDYEVAKPVLDFKIEMKPPKKQVSIY